MKVNRIYIGCTILIVLLLIATGSTYIYLNVFKNTNSQNSNSNSNNSNKKTEYKENNLNVVASLEDEVTLNSIWCGTFNIVWNELKEKIAKQDIILNEKSTLADNLNKSTFNISYLRDNSYYKTYGYQTYELRDKIKKDIKEKFNEESDILDNFDWEEKTDKIFLYAMLKKNFQFKNPFDELDKGNFNNFSNVKYFGIDDESNNKLREQVEVLYYKDYDNFAIKLLTKENEEVLLVKNPNGKNFLEIYNNILFNNKNYKGEKILKNNEYVSIPNIDFKTKVSFKELEGKTFNTSEGTIYRIAKTLQTINFSLDNKGGKLKSEAGLSIEKSSLADEKTRYFHINKTFAIFLKEKDKELPYFASLISDISEVQDKVKAN